MTVKDVAEKTGLTPYTIRYYAREGLLPMVKRDSHGVRIFSDGDLEAIYIIECLKNCGMTLKEIKQFTDWTLAGDDTIDRRLELFRSKLAEMQEKIRCMNETLDALRYKVWFYETAKAAGTVDVHEEIDAPPEMREIRARMRHVEHFTNGNFWRRNLE